MSVLFVAYQDWANVGYSLAECLKCCGVDAKAITLVSHSFLYPLQAEVVRTHKELQNWADKSDVVVFMHSWYTPSDYKGKRLFVYHGGTTYRQDPEVLNKFFNPLIEGAIVQTYDLLNMGAKNEHWLLPPVDTEKIQVIETKNDVLTFGHFPRHPDIKGTKVIYDLMQSLEDVFEFRFLTSTDIAPWEENLKRMGECDVYIEELAPPYEWGITALEAAALGKVVITDFKGLDSYRTVYGGCPLLVSNTPEELLDSIIYAIEMDKSDFLLKQRDTRKWVETYHSYDAVGERLRGILGV